MLNKERLENRNNRNNLNKQKVLGDREIFTHKTNKMFLNTL